MKSRIAEKPSQPDREVRTKGGKMAPSSTFPMKHVHDLNGVPLQSQRYKGKWVSALAPASRTRGSRQEEGKGAVQFPLPRKRQSSKNSETAPNVGPQEHFCK